MEALNILVVDDSQLLRNVITKLILSKISTATIDTAENGFVALQKLKEKEYHLMTLDLNMPVMDGIEFMKERQKERIDVPVIIFSSSAHSGATSTMVCLALGASDFLLKPDGNESMDQLSENLSNLIKLYGGSYYQKKKRSLRSKAEDIQPIQKQSVITPTNEKTLTKPTRKTETIKPQEQQDGKIVPLRKHGKIEIIAIGISTGGPNALRQMLAQIPPDLEQPIVIVQHMPEGFTQEFALSLNTICPLEVKEAQEGDILKKGRVFIAPGNKHMTIERKSLASVIHISDGEKRSGHRPSADMLFASVAKEFANNALGIIMTGMGRDGAEELAQMRKQGARTLGQDEGSSIVYGMPKAAFENGSVEEQVSLENMSKKIAELCQKK